MQFLIIQTKRHFGKLVSSGSNLLKLVITDMHTTVFVSKYHALCPSWWLFKAGLVIRYFDCRRLFRFQCPIPISQFGHLSLELLNQRGTNAYRQC